MHGTCGKCDGKGRIQAFAHIENGVCFVCGGTGKVEIRDAEVVATPKANPRLAEQKAWLQNCTAEQLRAMAWAQIYAAHTLAANMHYAGELSDRQFALVKREIERRVD